MASFFSSERPTLPPLHTLDLPVPLTQKARLCGPHDSYDPQSRQQLSTPQPWQHTRQVSMSSSTSSRTPSPTPSDCLALSHSSPHPPASSPTFRLVPCSFETADAIVVVPPPTAPFIPSLSSPSDGRSRQGQALLLVGPALQHFRHPNRQIAKGARIHPYRIVRGGRRPSDPSTMPV